MNNKAKAIAKDIGMQALAYILSAYDIARRHKKQIAAFIAAAGVFAAGIALERWTVHHFDTFASMTKGGMAAVGIFTVACILYGSFGMFCALFAHKKIRRRHR